MNTFQEAIKFVLKHEGGYVNDPNDAGGETNFGISKRSYPDVDIKNLTVADAMAIYKRDYWDANGLDNLDPSLGVSLFDAYVQHGHKIVEGFRYSADGIWRTLNNQRRLFYIRLAEKNPSNKRYLKGWLNRVVDLNKLCDIIDQST